MAKQWDRSLYEGRHWFVWKYGAGLLPLLNAQPGERILDLGCGTGQLTNEIASTGAHVIGMDSAVDMIGQARLNYPKIEFRLVDARSFRVTEPFDAVFSNAALHWIPEAESVIESVQLALKPGGRFVAEFGGKGNITHIVRELTSALAARGVTAKNTFFFPSVGEYTPLLERHGFEVRMAELFDRPTELEDPVRGMREWIEMFKSTWLNPLPKSEHPALFADVEDRLRPHLFRNGHWHADYRRLRFTAYKL